MPVELNVQERIKTGTNACRAIREKGLVPAIVYGGAIEGTRSVSIDSRTFEKVWREAGESTIVNLKGLPGADAVLIHEVATDPVTGAPVHVDLLAVRTDQAVEVAVPLVFIGTSGAEKELGGTLIKVMHELEIEALPKDLPHEIEVDVTGLKTFEDQIHVKDIVLPKGVTAVTDGEEVVALVQAAVEAEEEAAAPVDLSAIEVEKKGKEEAAEGE